MRYLNIHLFSIDLIYEFTIKTCSKILENFISILFFQSNFSVNFFFPLQKKKYGTESLFRRL